MNFYIDTEFTSLSDPRLISIGAVTDDGRSFYGIVGDFPHSTCTRFVREQVLPWLDLHPADANAPFDVLAWRFRDWLAEVSATSARPCRLFVDDEADLEMLRQLLRKGGWMPVDIEACCVLHPLSSANDALRALERWFNENPGRCRHNALDDAWAYRYAIVDHPASVPTPTAQGDTYEHA